MSEQERQNQAEDNEAASTGGKEQNRDNQTGQSKQDERGSGDSEQTGEGTGAKAGEYS